MSDELMAVAEEKMSWLRRAVDGSNSKIISLTPDSYREYVNDGDFINIFCTLIKAQYSVYDSRTSFALVFRRVDRKRWRLSVPDVQTSPSRCLADSQIFERKNLIAIFNPPNRFGDDSMLCENIPLVH